MTTPSQRLSIRLPQALVLGYVVLILLGTYLLSLPFAAQGTPLNVLDALFTATSAVCVTGLIVVDTATGFSRAGHLVIITLIQIGGLGIMTFSTFLLYVVSGRFSFHGRRLVMETLGTSNLSGLAPLLGSVFAFTVTMQAGGALLLWLAFSRTMPVGDAAFHSSFHAVSAFCNAGFGLDSQSLVPYRGAWGVYGCIMPLIVLGGLGFPVLYDLAGWATTRLRRALPAAGDHAGLVRSRPPRFSLHTRIALASSALLIVLPALCLFLLETRDWRRPSQKPAPSTIVRTTDVMADMSVPDRALAALFQSVTARTAGFNSAALDVDSMSTGSHFLLCLLMFVGGSPASTAGGIKTVAAPVLLLAVYSTLRGRQHVEVLGRTLPEPAVRRAGVVVVMMGLLVAGVALALCVTERAESTQEVLFESVSACGTVGLSTGLTPRLTYAGRAIIMLAMFAGRLGPLTLLIALAGRTTSAPYEYPRESVIIA